MGEFYMYFFEKFKFHIEGQIIYVSRLKKHKCNTQGVLYCRILKTYCVLGSDFGLAKGNSQET